MDKVIGVDEALAEKEVVITADERAAALNGLAFDIGAWAKNKGFREDYEDAEWLAGLTRELNLNGDVGARLYRIAESHRRLANVCKLMLMVSELSEALEGMRDGGNYGEELADLIIRVLENADCNKVMIGDELVRKVAVNEGRPHKHGRTF